MTGLFKFFTVASAIVAAVCLIGLTDTTHQVVGSEVGAVLAVSLILLVLSGMAWTMSGKSNTVAALEKSAAAPPALSKGTDSASAVPVSAEEALGVLHNWRGENRTIRFRTYQVPDDAIDCLCSGRGRIEELTPFMVRLDVRDGAPANVSEPQGCIVSLRRATAFVLRNWASDNSVEEEKGALPHGPGACLTVEFRSGVRCDFQASSSEDRLPTAV